MSQLTASQCAAMRWFYHAGGSGSIQRQGVILCGGQRGRFLPETWLRLVTLGMVAAEAPMRICLSSQGREYCSRNLGPPDVTKTTFADNADDDGEDDA